MRVRSTFFTAQSKNQVDIWIFSVKDFKASSSLWEPPSVASSAEDFHQMSDTYVEGCGSRKKQKQKQKKERKNRQTFEKTNVKKKKKNTSVTN